MMQVVIFRVLFSVLFLLGGLPCWAQESAPLRTVRFIALGDPPPFRQEIRAGVRHELPPPPGSVPPLTMGVQMLNQEGKILPITDAEGTVAQSEVRLRLNQMTPPIFLPEQELTFQLLEGDEVWHSLRLPVKGSFLAVFWRPSKSENWSEIRSRVVPDGKEKFKIGDLRFINVGPVITRFEIKGEEEFELAAGQAKVRSLGTSTGAPTTVSYRDPRRGWRRFWSSALVQNRGERSTVFVYRADGEKPRRPLNLITLRERIAPIEVPPSRPEATNR